MYWGILGLGAIAREFADALRDSGRRFDVAARDGGRAREFKDRHGADCAYASYAAMLEDAAIDIVYIATVNSQHLTNIRSCLEHGKHVLCEKAILGSAVELDEMRALASRRGLLLGEAMTIYHMPVMRKLGELIEAGELGDVKLVKADLGSLKEDDPTNRFFARELGGGAMLDIGTYALSFLRYFLRGSCVDVRQVSTKYPTGVDEMWVVAVRTEAGMLGCANLTFRAKLPKRAIVTGDKAYAVIDDYVRADSMTLVYPGGATRSIACGRTSDALVYEIDDFERAVAAGDSAQTHIEKTSDVVRIMEDLLGAERLSQPVVP